MTGGAALLAVASARTSVLTDDLLVMQGIRKRWRAKPVLESLDLTVPRGTLVSICGANGAGKTTLLRVAAGLIHPDEGEVAVGGLHPERDRRAYLTHVGFLSTGDRGLYARLSARRHLDLAARLSLLSGRDRKAAVERAVDLFALEDFAHRRVDRLSAGQRQRVRLAMALVHSPALVLLDEPANSLDNEGLDILGRCLEQVRDRGASVVWCAPEGPGAPLEADTELRLSAGRLQPA